MHPTHTLWKGACGVHTLLTHINMKYAPYVSGGVKKKVLSVGIM